MHRFRYSNRRCPLEDLSAREDNTYLCHVLVEPLVPVHDASITDVLLAHFAKLPYEILEGLLLILLKSQLLLQPAVFAFERDNLTFLLLHDLLQAVIDCPEH